MQIFGEAMLTASLLPSFGAAMLTASLPWSLGAVIALLAAVGLDSLVDETAVALTLVRLAFLVAVRLLIRDFFSMDIVCSCYF
jgi:hypothetical protein